MLSISKVTTRKRIYTVAHRPSFDIIFKILSSHSILTEEKALGNLIFEDSIMAHMSLN